MNWYRLLLEKYARDVGISTAVGVTAGMQAAISQDSDVPLESRVDVALLEILEALEKGPRLPAIVEGESVPHLPRKRGRPRKNPEGSEGGA